MAVAVVEGGVLRPASEFFAVAAVSETRCQQGGFERVSVKLGRIARKRGGARVVYLYGGEDLPIFLITVYAKSEKGNLSKAEQNALAKMATSFFNDYRRRP